MFLILLFLMMMTIGICALVVVILNYGISGKDAAVHEERWKAGYRYVLLASMVFAGIFVFCMYENVESITYAVLVTAYLVIAAKILKKWQISMKKGNYICGGIMIATALSTAFTNNHVIHGINYLIILSSAMIFVIISYVNMQEKDILQWFRYLMLMAWEGFFGSFKGITHLKYWKEQKETKKNNVKYIVTGVLCGIPLVFIVLLMLLSADPIFADVIGNIFQWDWSVDFIKITILFLVVFCGFYGMMYGGMHVSLKEIPKWQKKGEAVTAITISSMIAVIYIVFCLVQIRYLFLGGIWELPEQFTYAEYARQGFFQLLFVSLINYVMVIAGTYGFKESRVLRFLLLLISGCTYIMLASSFYRMVLYVKVYHLTFLRILVLWFLVVLAILFGILISAMYCKNLNFLKYTVFVAVGSYLIFAFAKPDYWAAFYNTRMQESISYDEWCELAENLSLDAAPVLWKQTPAEAKEKKKEIYKDRSDGWNSDKEYYESVKNKYQEEIEKAYGEMGIRKFNFSLYLAEKAIKEERKM